MQNAYFKPDKGASLFEYDFKPVAKNLSDNMTRREEGYHSKLKDAQIVGQQKPNSANETASIHDLVLAKEEGLMDYLNYDWYERKSFIDHFIGVESGLDDFEKAAYKEQGDFVNQPYELTSKIRRKDRVELLFERVGNVWVDGSFEPIIIRKKLTVFNESAEITADYEIINNSGKDLNLRFAVEFNYGLQAGHTDDRYYYNNQGRLPDAWLDSRGELSDQDFIGLKDEYLKVDIQLSAESLDNIWRVPVETISLSESGFEKVYQSSSVLLIWNISLGKNWNKTITQKVTTF